MLVTNEKKTNMFSYIAHIITAVLWIFMLLYQPPLKISIIYLLTIVSIVYLGIHLIKMPVISKRIIQKTMLLIMCVMYMYVVVTMQQKSISEFSHLFWILMCIFPSSCAIAIFFRKMDVGFDEIFHAILYASIIQAAIALLSLFMPNVHDFFTKIMEENGLYATKHIEKWDYRIYGYGISLMFAIPITQGVIAGWSIIYGMDKRSPIYYFIGGVIFFSAIINAKTAIVTFIITMLIGIIRLKKNVPQKILSLIVIVAIAYMSFNWLSAYLLRYNSKLHDWISVLSDSTKMETYYIDYYTDAEKWRLPEGIRYIFGTGASTGYYGWDVDMGIINDFWLGGLLYIFFILFFVYILYRDVSNSAVYPKSWGGIISVSLLIAFFVADTKGVAFNYSTLLALFMLLSIVGELCCQKGE